MRQLAGTSSVKRSALSRRVRGARARQSQCRSRALAKPASSESVSESADYPSSLIGSTKTTFVAETLLPTRNGKYRLRGYRHTVRRALAWPVRTCRAHAAVVHMRPGEAYHAMYSAVLLLRRPRVTGASARRWTGGARAPSPRRSSTASRRAAPRCASASFAVLGVTTSGVLSAGLLLVACVVRASPGC